MKYASKLSAVLFRIINSPLRRHLFDAKEKTGKRFFDLIKSIFDNIAASEEFKDTQLLQNEYAYDVYWNNDIFREIPSKRLIGALKTI